MDKISIMLVDDHQMIRIGLSAFLNTQPDIDVIAEASSGQDAIKQLEKIVPDVILMDLIMPEMGGVEATRRIKQISPNTHVIILTSHHDDKHIFPAIRAGAISYLLKDVDPDDLADAIRKANRGEATLSPQVAARLMADLQKNTPDSINAYTSLTERELEVLQIIAQGKSNQEIADALVVSIKTVKSHVSNILRKLHLADRTQAAVFAWREGMMEDEGSA